MKAEHSIKNPLRAAERRDRYAAPRVRTYTTREILDALGPAQGLTSGASPEAYLSDSPGHGHGHGHGRH